MFNTMQMPEYVQAHTQELLAEADRARLAEAVGQGAGRSGERTPLLQGVRALVARLVAPAVPREAGVGIKVHRA